MTEAEWLECKDIEPMLECLVTMNYPDAEPCNWGRGERRKRLFVFACLSRIWDLLPNEYRQAFELIDPDVDSNVAKENRKRIWAAAESLSCVHSDLLFAVGYDDIGLLCDIAAHIAGRADKSGKDRQTKARQHQEERAQNSLLRDIFGNPFQPIKTRSAWLTPNVVKLAQTIYDDRTFERFPALADALEEAGCKNEEILAHCRGPAPHCRGCWVVDLILGKK